MEYPPYIYQTPQGYEEYFYRIYCSSPIDTFDGISVRFRKTDFYHCFFESSRRDKAKDKFSVKRAEKIDWIKATLQDPDADLRIGWDSESKGYKMNRRVALVKGNYVVVVQLKKNMKEAVFITAFVAEGDSSCKILAGPKWE